MFSKGDYWLYSGTTNNFVFVLYKRQKDKNHWAVTVDKPCVNPVPSETPVYYSCAYKTGYTMFKTHRTHI